MGKAIAGQSKAMIMGQGGFEVLLRFAHCLGRAFPHRVAPPHVFGIEMCTAMGCAMELCRWKMSRSGDSYLVANR